MTVSSSTNKVSFNGDGSTTVFAYSFKVFAESDLTVILRASDGTETTQTITTNYTVSGVGDAGGGNVTMVTAPASGEQLTILREQPLTQGLDLVPNDPFPANSIEDSLDKLTFMVQQQQEELDRSIKASKTTTINTVEFVESAATRANKVFAFDGSGELDLTQEIGTFQGDWAASTAYAVRDIVKDTNNNNIYIANTAHTSSGTVPLTGNADIAKWDLLVDAAAATTSANNAATSATAAATSATAAATSATAASTSESNAATSASNASTSETNAAASATNAATSESNAAGSESAAATSETNAATSATSASTSASAAATSATNASTSETAAAASQSAAATSETNAATSATSAATNATNAATSATNAATSETNAATSETNAATSATAAAASQTAAAASAASAASAFDNFDDTYLGSKTSDPTVDNDGDPLTSGDLYFNSTANEMRVYDGANWIAATSAGNVSLLNYNYTATSGQTTFSGADDNAATLSYTQQNLIVTLNGVVLEDGTDYTANNGTSIVLASGAALNDELNIISFKSFTTADMVPASTGGTFSGNVAFSGDLTVDTNTLYVDSTNNRVGIGTTPSGVKLDVAGTIRSTVSGGTPIMYLNNGTTQHSIENVSGALVFKEDAVEAARIDASGNLLVGKASTGGNTEGMQIIAGSFFSHVRDDGVVQILNRKTSDGDILSFEKDNTTVGSIGVYSSDNFYLQGKSDHSGLAFGEAEIYGFRGGSENDGVTSLGSAAGRFKDLYLSGGVYLGGTGSANHLTDYEQGTFTPTLRASGTQFTSVTYSFQNGNYTKIGREVVVHIALTASGISGGTGALYIGNLPFSIAGRGGGSVGYISGLNYDSATYSQIGIYTPSGGTDLKFTLSGDNAGAIEVPIGNFTSSFDTIVSFTYRTS